MPRLASVFSTIIRETYWTFCNRCQRETAHRVLDNQGPDGTWEVWRCTACGASRAVPEGRA